MKDPVFMALTRPAHSWPRRGHTIVATGDQREPVVTIGNIPVPAGGECAGATHTPFVRPLRGQERKSQSGDWRSQGSQPTPGNVDAAFCRVLAGPEARRKRLEASSTLDDTAEGLMP